MSSCGFVCKQIKRVSTRDVFSCFFSLTGERLSHSSCSPTSPCFTFTLSLSKSTSLQAVIIVYIFLSCVSYYQRGFFLSRREIRHGRKRDRTFLFMTHGTTTKINRRGGDLFCKFVFAFNSHHQCCFRKPRVTGAVLGKEWQ